MKLILGITRGEHGGAQSHVLTLIDNFRSRCLIELIIGEDNFLAQEARLRNIKVHHVPSLVQPISPLRDLIATHDVARILTSSKPDLFHVHSTKAGIVGRLAGASTKTPTVFTAHGWAFTEGIQGIRSSIALNLEKTLGPFTRRIITVSEYDLNLAQRHGIARNKKMIAIHNGIDPNASRAQSPHSNSMNLVMVARFSPQKDYTTLIKAASLTRDLNLSFIGDGELLQQMKQLVVSLGISNRVNFLGTRSDVQEILAGNNTFALISNYEGFPISILEAMRAGLPVIASDVGGVREAVLDGVTGRLVPRGDVNALASALQELANDPAKRLQMGEAGRQRFLERFTLQSMLDKTWAVYEEVLAEASSRRAKQRKVFGI